MFCSSGFAQVVSCFLRERNTTCPPPFPLDLGKGELWLRRLGQDRLQWSPVLWVPSLPYFLGVSYSTHDRTKAPSLSCCLPRVSTWIRPYSCNSSVCVCTSVCGIRSYRLVHSQVQNWQQLKPEHHDICKHQNLFSKSNYCHLLPIYNYKDEPEAGFRTGSDCKHLVGRHSSHSPSCCRHLAVYMEGAS